MSQIFVWTLSDVIGLIVFGLISVVAFTLWLRVAVDQWFCKHNDGVNETQACDAICQQCGKNLGFIGEWRKQQKAQS